MKAIDSIIIPAKNPKDWLYVDYLINPLPAAAISLMALNDHCLKYAYPGWITGKLSDFLGVFYFPLFLMAIMTFFANYILRFKKPIYLNKWGLLTFSLVTAIIMSMINLSETIAGQVEQNFSYYFFKISITSDPTDLVSLISLLPTLMYASHFQENSRL